MNFGVGISKEKDSEAAFSEAYRKSLQKLRATKADLSMVFFSYDHGMDPTALAGSLKRVFRDTPTFGTSTTTAWFGVDGFELETGVLVISFKDLGFEFELLKVHSLKEKADLWAAELSRQIQDAASLGKPIPDFTFVMADSLTFKAGEGFSNLEKTFSKAGFCGVGASYSVPQVSVICRNEVYMNSLVAWTWRGVRPWVGLAQNVRPELNPVNINRMSENLMIEIDEKPAFYKLSEHLMAHDDLPMMSPDEFRKHMGDLFLVEGDRSETERMRVRGRAYEVISLLGSEMTTGMVAVARDLDFSKLHYLGQRKASYAEEDLKSVLEQIKAEVSKPQFLMSFSSLSRLRDRDRKISDRSIIRSVFPEVPHVEIATQGEYLGCSNQYASMILAFE